MAGSAIHNLMAGPGFEDAGRGRYGTVTWSSPSNIALIKYWGKKGFQLPANPSLSVTLDKARTITSVHFESVPEGKSRIAEFLFEGTENTKFSSKAYSLLDNVREYMPFLAGLNLRIDTRNTFPHSAGIASSASSMSALALCLVSIGKHLFNPSMSDSDFFAGASFLARIGSGSAARSVYGGYVSWGQIPPIDGSCDEAAMPCDHFRGEYFGSLCDAILIVDSSPKKVGSTRGHELMSSNVFAEQRFTQAARNLEQLLHAGDSNDIDSFIAIVEEEALTLHTMMMTSRPSFILFEPATIEIIRRIRLWRESTGVRAMFTLDAGPNVHLLYTKNDDAAVRQFIDAELTGFCESGKVIFDNMGAGPVKLGEEHD